MIHVTRQPATGGVLATTHAVLHVMHWMSSTAGAGVVVLRDGRSATGTVAATFDLPAIRSAGSFVLKGGGLKFGDGIFAGLTNVGGITISYDDLD